MLEKALQPVVLAASLGNDWLISSTQLREYCPAIYYHQKNRQFFDRLERAGLIEDAGLQQYENRKVRQYRVTDLALRQFAWYHDELADQMIRKSRRRQSRASA